MAFTETSLSFFLSSKGTDRTTVAILENGYTTLIQSEGLSVREGVLHG